MNTFGAIQIRSLNQHDPPVIAAAFASFGSVKPEEKYQLYLEQEAAGLHAGYSAAQRLYGLRGYIPDGRGVTYREQYVQVMLDDDLVLHLTKQLRLET